jgi:hypothetical protein
MAVWALRGTHVLLLVHLPPAFLSLVSRCSQSSSSSFEGCVKK